MQPFGQRYEQEYSESGNQRNHAGSVIPCRCQSLSRTFKRLYSVAPRVQNKPAQRGGGVRDKWKPEPGRESNALGLEKFGPALKG